MEYTIVVAVRDNDDGNEFLMVRHKDRGWELPGGKIEEKEGPVRCALREFKEETGHLLDDPKYVFRLEKDHGTCHVFAGTLGEEVAGMDDDEAIVQAKWFDRLPDEDLAFPDDPYQAMGDALGIRFR